MDCSERAVLVVHALKIVVPPLCASTAPIAGYGPRRDGKHVAGKDLRLSGEARRPGGPDRLHPCGEFSEANTPPS